MHSNNTQVQVQIPAYYALGGVAMSSSMGFSGGGSTIEPGHSEHIGGPLHPYHLQQNTSPHHPHHSPSHGPNHTNTYNSSITSPANNNNNNNSTNNSNNYHSYQNEQLKAFPHQIDIYQPPPQTHEQDLMNPLMHRHLNSHASNYHAPYHYHHHHSNNHNNHYTSKHQQQQQQQQHSNASTPTPTVASTMSVSTASTPSLSSPHASTLSADYSYNVASSTPGANTNRHSSPTTPSFHIPSSPDQIVVPQGLPNWAAPSEPSHQSPREYMKNERTSSPSYYQYGVPEEVQDILDDRQDKSLGLANTPVYENDSDRRSQSRSSGMVRMTDFAVPSQTPTAALGALPLLSPSNMIQSDYHQASLGLDAPTIMSHMEYNNNTNRYSTGGPTRTAKRNSGRTTPNNHRDSYSSRTRASSLNSTTSSVASSGILTSLANTMGSTMLSSPTSMDQPYEPEDPASPTSMPRPRPPAAPRKALAARVFSCSVPGCTKSYTQLHNLKSHERTGHTPVIKLKPFHCIIEGCPKAYSQRKSLAIHIKSAHEDFKFKPFKCLQPGCDKAYTQLHNLRTHEKTVHLLDLSRKRTKNTSSSASSSSSSSMSHMMPHHQHQSGLDMRYNHLEDLAALGLEMDDDAQGEEEDHEEYARQQHHHQDHHMHHHSYSRAFSSMHHQHHHQMNPNTNAMMGPLPGQHRV
ncbi:hypothetical protein BG006_006124 [Podila minutissima]|uniref:C2H2-type domain-containing protein n=1 Tax=Podila minutissima TaxID=64525 RepID=A0A9P5SLN1_9FUNG|nr:hypothetical protein BG006_006124 [Podila minutissima]